MPLEDTVFVTGFPGFIAGRLVEKLASEGARMLLLVQPALLDRAKEEVGEFRLSGRYTADQFVILPGDITQPALGLSPDDLELAQNETTTIFHLAALYDLAVKRRLAMKVNLEGTQNVNNFALFLPKLRRYHYISTCYVAGKRKGVIREDELVHTAGFRNYYEQSKYLAEIEVAAMMQRIPVTIHRPAVVVGDTRTGETAKYDGIYYLLQYLRRAPHLLSIPNIGNKRVSLNLVPVDFVVDAMAALANDDEAIGKTVQLADPAPLTTEQLFNALAVALGGQRSWFTTPMNLVYYSLRSPLGPPITGLPRVAVPYFFLEQTYDTALSHPLLEKHQIRCPWFPSYVDRMVEFVRNHPVI
jgi:thioester reductase-like protein